MNVALNASQNIQVEGRPN